MAEGKPVEASEAETGVFQAIRQAVAGVLVKIASAIWIPTAATTHGTMSASPSAPTIAVDAEEAPEMGGERPVMDVRLPMLRAAGDVRARTVFATRMPSAV